MVCISVCFLADISSEVTTAYFIKANWNNNNIQWLGDTLTRECGVAREPVGYKRLLRGTGYYCDTDFCNVASHISNAGLVPIVASIILHILQSNI